MRLTRLEAEDFLSYEALDLDLSHAYQLGVVGQTGAGKSSLLDMVMYALFGAGRMSPDDLIRKGAERCVAAVEFDLGGRHYRVRRERDSHTKRGESGLTFEMDGARISQHAVPETQARIAKELGLSATALLAGPIMWQRETEAEPHDLMRLKEAPRLDLLIELFGLLRFAAYHARAKEWGLQVHGDLDLLEARVTELDELIAGELEARRDRDGQQAALDALTVEVDRMGEEITTKREEAAALQERAARQEALNAELTGLQEDLDEETGRLGSLQEQTQKKHDRLALPPVLPPTNDVDAIAALIAGVPLDPGRLDTLKNRRGELAVLWRSQRDAAKLIDHVPCQTRLKDAQDAELCLGCQFLVDANAAREALPETTGEGTTVKAEIEDLEQKVAHVATLKRDLDLAVGQRSKFLLDDQERTSAQEFVDGAGAQMLAMQATIARLSKAITKGNAERTRIAQDAARRQELASTLLTLNEKWEDARNERRGAERRLLAAETKLAQIDDAKERRTAAEEKRAALATRAEALRLLTQAFHRDGIPKLILENGLVLVEERANEVLARMPGGWQVAVHTQKELKTGGTAEALDVVITAGGFEFPYRLLSGGERFRIDFALRMALATFLARRSGTTIDTLWLDEGWGSQDREGREALLDAINAVADEFALIVVVSHVPEVTDAMPQRLEVTKEDGVSTAVIVE